MTAERSQPELSTVNNYNRKFGRYDFKRFDHLVSQHASLGATSLGKIHVDCKFLFKKSKWGTLENRDPAGIVYLDLSFNQPSDCRLKCATVQVTLDDEDERLARQFPSHSSELPVQIVKYGPRHMTGKPQYEQVSKHTRLIPTVEVGPLGGAGGLGIESEKVSVRECRWMFESHLKTGSRKRSKNSWAYRVLQWNITENELESQSLHNTVHTAFAFVHSEKPFFMRVEVSGKLENRVSHFGYKIKDKIRKLKFPANPQSARYATTLVNFNGRDRFTAPLDGLVQGLELAMENENMAVPVEVGKPQQASFFEAPPVPDLPNMPGRPMDDHNLLHAEDPTAPTIENLTSLSSMWLMAPPITPLAPIPDPEESNDISTAPSSQRQSSTTPTTPTVLTTPSNAEAEEPASVDLQTGPEDEVAGAVPVTMRSNKLQRRVAPGQVDLSTVMFLMRIWMLQTIAALLGYTDERANQSPMME